MKNTLFIILFFFLLISCEKEGTITGRLVDACGSPLDSVRVNITDNHEGGKNVAIGYTDSGGYFSIPYKSKHHSFRLKAMSTSNFTSIIKDIPAKKHIDFGAINTTVIFSLNIKLQVTNTYSSNDTLFIDIEGGTQPASFSIPGPFISGVADSLMNQTLTSLPYKYDEKPSISYSYRFSRHPQVFHSKKSIHSCSMNEIVFKID